MDLKRGLSFLGLWIVNSLFFIIFSNFTGNNLIVGNADVTSGLSASLTGLVLTILVFACPYALKWADVKTKDERVMTGTYFAANTLGIWVLKRLADFTGLGIANNLIVLVLALTLTALQVWFLKASAKVLSK